MDHVERRYWFVFALHQINLVIWTSTNIGINTCEEDFVDMFWIMPKINAGSSSHFIWQIWPYGQIVIWGVNTLNHSKDER